MPGPARRGASCVAIAGPPGAGKSTLADRLRRRWGPGERGAVLPMDGFHLDNAILIERGLLARKGAPETFDVRGFLDIVRPSVPPTRSSSCRSSTARARSPSPRRAWCPPSTASSSSRATTSCSTRGNGPNSRGCSTIRSCWHRRSRLLEERLWARWRGYGLAEDAARAKVYDNDLPNGRLILENRRPADLTLENA